MNDDELEQVMRAGLGARAAQADDAGPVLARVRPVARRRPRAVVAIVGLAAASLVGAGLVATLLTRGDDERAAVDASSASDVAVDAGAGTGRWRVETWRDIQVEVPADWGYGAAPDDQGVACYPEAILDAAGRQLSGAAHAPGYVGRPVAMTDVCASLDAGGPVSGPYVWLGAGLPAGVEQLGDGLVQETVEVDGSTVTVATQDAALRERILDSVSGSESCLSEVDRSGSIAHDRAADRGAAPASLRVCTYRLSDDRSIAAGWELTSASDLGADALTSYLDGVAGGDPARDQCPTIDYQLTEAVVLEILDDAGQVLRQDAVNPSTSCSGVAVGADRVWQLETTTLTPAMTQPWVVGAVGAVIHGDPRFGFIGPQG